MKIDDQCRILNLVEEKVHDRMFSVKEAFYGKLVLLDDNLIDTIINEIASAPEKLENGIPDGGFCWDGRTAIKRAFRESSTEFSPEMADQYAVLLIRFESDKIMFISAELMRIDSFDIATPYGAPPTVSAFTMATYN